MEVSCRDHPGDWRRAASRQTGSSRELGRREAAGLSQEALAARAEVHRNYVGLLERGQRVPTILVVQQLARALDTTMSDLLAEVEEES